MEDAKQEFKVGDVVQLRSGGPAMTVGAIRDDGTVGAIQDDGALECGWFDSTGNIRVHKFPPGTLVEREGWQKAMLHYRDARKAGA